MAFQSSKPESELGRRFATAWERDVADPPEAPSWLRDHASAPVEELAELVRLDLRFRATRGELLPVEHYLSSCPSLAGQPELLLDLVRLEFELKHDSQSSTAKASEVTQRFPQLQQLPELERTLTQSFPASSSGPEPAPTSPTDPAPAPRDGSAPLDQSTQGYHRDDRSTLGFSGGGGSVAGPGATFGDYELLEEIARGGMGVVFKARQRKLNRLVALKMILSGQLASGEEVRRFYSEAEAAANLDHPGIVPIYEVNEIGGQHFFSMGYIDGSSLSERLRDGPLGLREAAEMMIRVAESVEYAHQHGIVHRDLKPGNILLTADGQPKVTDFGLAKTVEGDSGLTATGQILGTPSYMPPEQAAGDLEAIGPASDVYALGAVLYFLLTGRPPFQSSNVVETIRQVLERDPVAPRLLNPSVDRDLQTICLKCLEKSPRARFATAQEFADELKRYRDGEPIRSRRIGPVTRAWRWCRRKPVVVGFAAALILLAVVSFAAWHSMQAASEVREVAGLQAEFEARVDAPELTGEYLQQMDALLEQIGRALPAEAATGRQRLQDRFFQAIENELLQPRLEQSDADRIETALALLEARDASAGPRADALRRDLQRRLSGWTERLHLAAPFTELDRAFQLRQVSRSGDVLELVEPLPPPEHGRLLPYVPLGIDSGSSVQFRVEFDASWRTSSRFGLVLDGTAERAYMFLVHLPKRRPPSTPAAGARGPRTPEGTTDEEGRAGTEARRVVVEILKHGTLQQREEIPLDQLPEGPLTLHVTRNQDQLTFQVQQLPPVVFRDVFALASSAESTTGTVGKFGIVWPQNVPIKQLTILERQQPPEPSELQRGDRLYDEQRFEEALPFYRRLSLTSKESAIRQEAEYKEGMCLLHLNRNVDARQTFEPLFAENGEPWPILAGCQLWLVHIRNGDSESAEAVYQSLSARYQFEQLATLLPRGVRDEIVESYLQEVGNVSALLRYNPQRARNIERAAAIDRLLSADGFGNRWTQIELARAYRYIGQMDDALLITGEQAERHRDATLFRLYSRMLRLTGSPETALEKINVAIGEHRDQRRGPHDFLLIERSRVYIALQRWQEAESDIDFLLMQADRVAPISLSYIYLIKGFLRAREGQEAMARHYWKRGYVDSKAHILALKTTTTELLNLLVLGSLSDSLEPEVADQFLATALGDSSGQGSNALVRMVRSVVGPSTFHQALLRMWQTPRGRMHSENLAFGRYTFAQRVRTPLQLAVLEFVRQNAFRGELSSEQEDAIWQLTEDTFEAVVRKGTVQGAQVVQLGLSWKGTMSVLGWAGVAPTLESRMRAAAAYVLAHRYMLRGEPQHTNSLLQEIVASEADLPRLKTLASEDLKRLEEQTGLVRFQNRSGLPVAIRIKTTGANTSPAVPDPVDVQQNTEVELPVGRYELEIVKPMPVETATEPSIEASSAVDNAVDEVFQLSVSQVQVHPMGRLTVELHHRSLDAPLSSLPGIVARPATESDGRAWQRLLRRSSAGRPSLAWHPDGTRIATGGPNGTVRVVDAETGQLFQVLPGHTMEVMSLDWTSDGRRLVSGSRDHTVRIWDAEAGRPLRVLTGHRSPIVSVRAGADSGTIASSDQAGAILLWKLDAPDPVRLEGHAQGASWVDWHPEGRLLASVGNGDGMIRIWDTNEPSVLKTLGPFQDLRAVGWSRDGKLLAFRSTTELRVVETTDWSERLKHELRRPDSDIGWQSASRLLLSDAQELFAFDFTDPSPTASLVGEVRRVETFRLNAAGTHVAATRWNTGVRIFELGQDRVPRAEWSASVPSVRHIAWNRDGTQLAVCGHHGIVQVIDRRTLVRRMLPVADHQPMTHISWSPDDKYLVAGTNDGRIRLWSAEGKDVHVFPGHKGYVPAITWISPTEFASVGADRTLRVWNVAGESLQTHEADNSFTAVAWHAATERIFAVGEDRRLHVFDRSLKLLGSTLVSKIDGVKGLRLNQDASIALIAHPYLVFPLHHLTKGEDGTLTAAPGPRMVSNSAFAASDWSPEADRFVAGGKQGELHIWSLRGEQQNSLPGHRGQVLAADWSSRNEIATVADDHTLRIWDAETGREQWTWLFLPDDQFQVTKPTGHVLTQSEKADEHLVRVVQQPDGSFQLEE